MTEAGKYIQSQLTELNEKLYTQALIDGIIIVRDMIDKSDDGSITVKDIRDACTEFVRQCTTPDDEHDNLINKLPDDEEEKDEEESPTVEDSLKKESEKYGLEDSAFSDLMSFMQDSNVNVSSTDNTPSEVFEPSSDDIIDGDVFYEANNDTKPI